MVAEILTKQIGVNYKKDLYQLLLRVYLCQRWIVEFKGIMQPVLFMIFFSDFVTPQKRRLLVIYFKNYSAIFRKQGFYFQVISAKCGYW